MTFWRGFWEWLRKLLPLSFVIGAAGLVLKYWVDALEWSFGVTGWQWILSLRLVPNWAASTVAFFACLCLWLFTQNRALKHRLERVELDVEFDTERIQDCTNDWQGGGGIAYRQFRMRVSNTRTKQTIRDVSGQITAQRIKPPGGRLFEQAPPLTWAFEDGPIALAFYTGRCQYLNLLQLDSSGRAGFLTTDKKPPRSPFDIPGEYEVVAKVLSHDTDPKMVRFVFHWTGLPYTSTVSDVEISQ
jgi:hypothetical protein